MNHKDNCINIISILLFVILIILYLTIIMNTWASLLPAGDGSIKSCMAKGQEFITVETLQ